MYVEPYQRLYVAAAVPSIIYIVALAVPCSVHSSRQNEVNTVGADRLA